MAFAQRDAPELTDRTSLSQALPFFFAAFCAWLTFGTGPAPDDYARVIELKGFPGESLFLPNQVTIAFPIEHYTHSLAYWALGYDRWIWIEALKAFYAVACWLSGYLFFRRYATPGRACLASFATWFLVIHDSTAFAFINYYLSLSLAFYFAGMWCIHRGWVPGAVAFFVCGAFISYGSPALTAGFTLLAFLEHGWKRAATVALPGLLYVLYYLFVTLVLEAGPPRLQHAYGIASVAKDFLLQVASFVDATAGPSGWAKIALSMYSVQISDVAIAMALLAACVYCASSEASPRRNASLIAALVVISVAALGIFSLTGRYPQIAFGMGDRVLLLTAIPMAYLIATHPSRAVNTVVTLVLVMSAAGASRHWKEWGQMQSDALRHAAHRTNWRACSESEQLAVLGARYSLLGPFGHIEFLSEDYVARAVLAVAGAPVQPLAVLTPHHRFENGSLKDLKYGTSTPISIPINVWNVAADLVTCVKPDGLQVVLASIPRDTRHWLQLPQLRPLTEPLASLFSQYAYLFDSRRQ